MTHELIHFTGPCEIWQGPVFFCFVFKTRASAFWNSILQYADHMFINSGLDFICFTFTNWAGSEFGVVIHFWHEVYYPHIWLHCQVCNSADSYKHRQLIISKIRAPLPGHNSFTLCQPWMVIRSKIVEVMCSVLFALYNFACINVCLHNFVSPQPSACSE